MTPCTAGEIRPLLADMIPDVDTTGMGTYEIMNLIKALLRDRSKSEIVDRLKSMIPEATAPAMTLNEVLTTIEHRLAAGKAKIKTAHEYDVEIKTLTERLGTSYAREMALTRDLTEVKTRLQTAGKESADLARALHLAEDKINTQHNAHAETMARIRTALGVGKTATSNYIVETIESGKGLVENLRTELVQTQSVLTDRVCDLSTLKGECKTQRTILTGVCGLLGLSADGAMYGEIVDKVGTLVQNRSQVREDLRLAPGERVDLHGLREDLCKAAGLPAHTSMPVAVAHAVEALSAERKVVIMAERSTLARFRDDMRTVLGEPTATAKYMVDTVDEMRRDLTTIKNVLGMDWTVTTGQVVIKIQTQIKDLDRVRDAIGLRESAPMDYVVQRIADTRRDLHWAQGTLSMVSTALSSSHAAERAEIMARLSGTIKERDRAQERFSELVGVLCEDLAMPFCGTNPIRDEIKARSKELAEVRNALTGAVHELNTIKNALGVGPGTTASEIADKFKDLPTHLDALNHVLRGVWTPADAVTAATTKIKYMQAQTARLRKIVGNAETLHGAVDMVASLAAERRALIRFLDMAESTTWHEITNEVVRRISYTNGVLAGIGDSIKTLAQIVGLDPTVASLPVPGPLPSVINTLTAIRDCLLAVVGHPGGETLSLNAALSLVQSKVSAVALSLGLSEYASLLVIKAGVENLRKDRDLQARTITTLTTNQDAQIQGQYKIRERLLTLLCEDPNRAGTMTTDEVVNLLKSKFACLALNLSLPEDATLNTIMERIQNVIMDQFHGSSGSLPALRELVLTMGQTETMSANEAMVSATARIKGMREALHNLLSTWS